MNNSTAQLLSSQDSTPTILNSLDLLQVIVNSALDAKATDVTVLNVEGLSDVANYYVILSGRSDRQVLGISNRIVDECSKIHIGVDALEGLEKAQWVLIELADIIVHVFYQPTREHYNLEGLWLKAKPLRVSPPNKDGHVKVS